MVCSLVSTYVFNSNPQYYANIKLPIVCVWSWLTVDTDSNEYSNQPVRFQLEY